MKTEKFTGPYKFYQSWTEDRCSSWELYKCLQYIFSCLNSKILQINKGISL